MELRPRDRKYLLLSLLLLVTITTALLGDEVVLKDGTIISGTILSADKDTLAVQVNGKLQPFAKADILTIRFAQADLLVLTTGEKIEGKVITKVGMDVHFLTDAGIRKIDNATIKQAHYNAGGTLQTSTLPPTGRQFKNDPKAAVVTQQFQKKLSGRLIFGYHFPSLKDWREQFELEGGGHPQTSGLQIGANIAYALIPNIALQLGYEYYIGPTVKVELTQPTFKDRISANFLFGGACIGWKSATNLRFYYYAAADIGLMQGKEEILDLDGVDIDYESEGLGVRVSIGLEYYTARNTSLTICVSYLMANLGEPTALGIDLEGYTHNFSGIGMLMSYSFHIPL